MTELEHILKNYDSTTFCSLVHAIKYKYTCDGKACGECVLFKNSNEIIKILLSEHKEKPQLTDDEKAILRNIKPDYQYIARDKDGDIYAYQTKPLKNIDVWGNKGFHVNVRAFNHLFQFIKWEDKEACKISDLLED